MPFFNAILEKIAIAVRRIYEEKEDNFKNTTFCRLYD